MNENGISEPPSDPAEAFSRALARLPGGAGAEKCFSCATCSAGCPVRKVFPDYDPRRILRMILLGRGEELLASPLPWLCSTCYACQERCPQGIPVTDLLVALRNLASRTGHKPAALQMQEDLLVKFGRLYEIDEFDNKKREKAGLPKVVMKAEAVARLHALVAAEPFPPRGTPEAETHPSGSRP